MNQEKYSKVVILILLFLSTACAMEKQMSAIDLIGTEWWIEDIDGNGVVDKSHSTLHFLEDGGVAGDTGCNRYRGTVEIAGNRISFGPMAGTRKACASSLMDQEMKFYQAIEKVVSWEVPATGLLVLRNTKGDTLMRASRIEK